MARSIRKIIWVLLSPNSLTIQCELLILRGIDINSPHYWSKQFGIYKKGLHHKPRPGCLQKLSFSKQTNQFANLYLLTCPENSPVKRYIIKWKANYASHWPVSITSKTITSSSAVTTWRALVLSNKLLITSSNPALTWWGRLVTRILFFSCLSKPILFQQRSLCLDLGQWFFLEGRVAALEVERTGWGWRKQRSLCWGRQRNVWMTAKRKPVEPIATKRKSVSQSASVFLLCLQRLPDFFSWLLPGHCACPCLWIICFIGSVCLSQRAWLAGWAYAVARELSQSGQGGSFPSVSRQVSRAVDVLAGEWERYEQEGRMQGEVEHVIVCACVWEQERER